MQRQRLTKSRKQLAHCPAEALLARMYAASFAREVPVFSDDALIACRQGSYVFDPSIHHLTRNACHFIACPIYGESAE